MNIHKYLQVLFILIFMLFLYNKNLQVLRYCGAFPVSQEFGSQKKKIKKKKPQLLIV